jgi:hypothetical protein
MGEDLNYASFKQLKAHIVSKEVIMVRLLPVYYVERSNPSIACPLNIDIHRSWDGSLYGECNVPLFCGPAVRVDTGDVKTGRSATVNWERCCGPASFYDEEGNYSPYKQPW